MAAKVTTSTDLKSYLERNGIGVKNLSFEYFPNKEGKEHLWFCSNGVRVCRVAEDTSKDKPMKVLHMVDDEDNSTWDFIINEVESTVKDSFSL